MSFLYCRSVAYARTLDQLLSKGYFYWARAVEITGKASSIRNELLAAYRTSVLKHDQIGQVTCMHRSHIKKHG